MKRLSDKPRSDYNGVKAAAKMSTDAVVVMSYLQPFPHGSPTKDLSIDAFGNSGMMARGRVMKALVEIRNIFGLRVDTHNMRPVGMQDLYSLPNETYDEAKEYLRVNLNKADRNVL